MKFTRQWFKGFVFEQHCIPWSVKKRLVQYRYLVRNINTKDYWDSVWQKEIEKGYRRDLGNLYSEILQRVPRGTKVLDVGCGEGEFLKRARGEKECDVFGVDISAIAIKHLSAKGIRGVVGKVPPIPAEDGTFDVVVATQLLEHVRSPKEVLQEIFRSTKIGGLCFISVPDTCLAPHDEPEHNHIFDKVKLTKLITRVSLGVSLEVISVKEAEANAKRLLAICRICNKKT